MSVRTFFKRYCSRTTVILLAIVFVGIFLRSYAFRDWLYFYPDQARDVMLVRDVVDRDSSWPLLGPIAASTPFKLGPMYYYFQIVSGELFGVRPETVAYPDLLFSILAIPLLFIFLRRYFSEYLSLVLTGLYSISEFAISYSRFAWNTNPIPFFSVLFLFALLRSVEAGEKTAWRWIVTLSIALGVGVQLHTVLLLLLPATLLLVLGYLLWQKRFRWNFVFVILFLSLLLNGGQLVSESRTNFHNTRDFWNVLSVRSPHAGNGVLKNITLDIICHAQASAHLLTSLDDKNYCDTFDDLNPLTKHRVDIFSFGMTWGAFLGGLCFLILTFVSGRYVYLHEGDVLKREFYAVIGIFFGLSFLVMLPVMDDNAPLRYFLPTFFVPLFFLGCIVRYLTRRFPVRGPVLIATLFVFCGLANAYSIAREASRFAHHAQSRSNYVVLGELEMMRQYILDHADGQKQIYFLGEQKFYQNYFKPFDFVFGEKGVIITKVRDIRTIEPGMPLFYMADDGEEYLAHDIPGHPILSSQTVGHVSIFMLKND